MSEISPALSAFYDDCTYWANFAHEKENMTLTLEITPEIETQLRADAERANVPLEALAFERLTGDSSHGAAARLWERLINPKTHNTAILEIAQAPAKVRDIIDAKSGAAAAAFYATPEGEAELVDWRALDGEPFDLGENE